MKGSKRQNFNIKTSSDAVYVVSSLTVHNSSVFLSTNCDRIS